MWPELIFAGAIGLALGGALAGLWLGRQRRQADQAVSEFRTRNELLAKDAQNLAGELAEARRQREETNVRREAAERQVATITEQLSSREQALAEVKQFIQGAELRFKELSAMALAANSEQVVNMAGQKLGPIKELLEKHQQAVGVLETKREAAYATLDQKIQQIATSHEKLGTETGRLVSALRRPEQRGRWGELQLRNVVELAGMAEHCDFDEQVTVWKGDQAQRPDMVVNLPGGGVIPVDSKVALDAYLDALQPETDRAAQLRRHADQVQKHVSRLADKGYAEKFERSPGVVVMFMPLESALVAALEVNPDLHAQAMARHVLIATPTLLVALLRAAAYGWQQEALAKNAQEIAVAGSELYNRLAIFVSHFEKVGTHLSRSTDAYDQAVGSLERNLLPSARRMKDLHAIVEPAIEPPPLLQKETRPIHAPELRLTRDVESA